MAVGDLDDTTPILDTHSLWLENLQGKASVLGLTTAAGKREEDSWRILNPLMFAPNVCEMKEVSL